MLSTPIRRAKRVLPLVVGEKKFIFFKRNKSAINLSQKFAFDLWQICFLKICFFKLKSTSPAGSPVGAAASYWWDTRGR